ncbi:MAG: hypothetical protein DRR06_08295 [Gammaproteobacteria bacterium]|nr:MAG: hypothetical protein DRR06_08295 [Gammaproteobacteria bacterium]RLA52429.1 MAG: hypothetical protein DRR42_07585 [Gammaproteobacteria bacterium]
MRSFCQNQAGADSVGIESCRPIISANALADKINNPLNAQLDGESAACLIEVVCMVDMVDSFCLKMLMMLVSQTDTFKKHR